MTTTDLARRIREHSLRMTHAAKVSHIGSCLSVADILAVLYASVAPTWLLADGGDEVIVSKGHAAAAVFAALAEVGMIDQTELAAFCKPGSRLIGHVNHEVPGIPVSTGSLGHGLPIACGMALAWQRSGAARRVYVVMSDGEMNCGTTWEAAAFAAHHRLPVTVVVDVNGLQGLGRTADVLRMPRLDARFAAFGWDALNVDGHDHAALSRLLFHGEVPSGPRVLVARTVKGKGVSFMENALAWHYQCVDDAQLAAALAEVSR